MAWRSCVISLGFLNEFATEAEPGALPVGQNAPQKHPLGLYAEQFSGTPFTAPRATNRRSWLYRIRPSTVHKPYTPVRAQRLIRGWPYPEAITSPNQLRWNPEPIPPGAVDFVDGIMTLGGNGDLSVQTGVAIHIYVATRSMQKRFFWNADGEFLVVPQEGTLLIFTELGKLEVAPGEICVLPRGLKYPRGAAGQGARAATSARTTGSRSGCRNWGRSARMDWRMRATF